MNKKELFAEEDFKENIDKVLKENLAFSMISFCFNILIERLDSDNSPKEIKDEFIKIWKNNMSEGAQKVLSDLNDRLNKENIDFHNIITGNKIYTTEDYQQMYNKSLKETEKIFWKLCEDDDLGSGPKDYNLIDNLI